MTVSERVPFHNRIVCIFMYEVITDEDSIDLHKFPPEEIEEIEIFSMRSYIEGNRKAIIRECSTLDDTTGHIVVRTNSGYACIEDYNFKALKKAILDGTFKPTTDPNYWSEPLLQSRDWWVLDYLPRQWVTRDVWHEASQEAPQLIRYLLQQAPVQSGSRKKDVPNRRPGNAGSPKTAEDDRDPHQSDRKGVKDTLGFIAANDIETLEKVLQEGEVPHLALTGEPLVQALKRKNKDAVVSLLRHGANPLVKVDRKDSFIAKLVKIKDLSFLEKIFAAGIRFDADILTELLDSVVRYNGRMLHQVDELCSKYDMELGHERIFEAAVQLQNATSIEKHIPHVSQELAFEMADLAVRRSLYRSFSVLLESGFIGSLPQTEKSRLLATAVIKENKYFLNLLLQSGAVPDVRYFNNDSLQGPYSFVGLEMTEMLCQYGLFKSMDGKQVGQILKYALSCRSLVILQGATASGIDINHYGPSDVPLVVQAVVQRCPEELILYIIENGADPDTTDKKGKHLLDIVMGQGYDGVFRCLVDGVTDLNRTDSAGATFLHTAVSLGRKDYALALLERGADPNIRDNSGNTPFHWACAAADREICALLEAYGADRSIPNGYGRTPGDILEGRPVSVQNHVYSAISSAEHLREILRKNESRNLKQLLALGLPVDSQVNGRGKTLLIYSICKHAFQCTELLLQAGAHPDRGDSRPPLIYALNKNMRAFRLLLKHGARISGLEEDIFRTACNSCNVDAVRFILEQGYKPAPGQLENAIRGISAHVGWETKKSFVRLMLEHGADPGIPVDKDGEPLFLHLVKRGKVDLVTLLLEAGTDSDLRNSRNQGAGFFVLNCSKHKNRDEMVRVLEKHGCRFDDGPVESPSLFMAYRQNRDLFKKMVECGADLDMRDVNGDSILHHVFREGDRYTAAYILSCGADPSAENRKGESVTELPGFSLQALLEEAEDEGWDFLGRLEARIEELEGAESRSPCM